MGKLLPRPEEIGQWADKLLVEQMWRRGSDPQNPWDLGAIAHTSQMCNPVASAVRGETEGRDGRILEGHTPGVCHSKQQETLP